MRKVFTATLALACAQALTVTNTGKKATSHTNQESFSEDIEKEATKSEDYEDPHAFAENLDEGETEANEKAHDDIHDEKHLDEHDPEHDAGAALEEEHADPLDPEHPEHTITSHVDLEDPEHPELGEKSIFQDDEVVHLHENNFKEMMEKHEFVMANFYKHQSDPQFAKAASVLQARGVPIMMAKVDTVKNDAFANQFKIDHLPEKKFFHNGVEIDYTGGFAEEDIVNWVLKETGHLSEKISCSEVKAKTDGKPLNVVFFGDVETALYKTFEHAAGRTKQEFTFFNTDASCVPSNMGGAPAIVLYRNFDTTPI